MYIVTEEAEEVLGCWRIRIALLSVMLEGLGRWRICIELLSLTLDALGGQSTCITWGVGASTCVSY